MVFIVCGALLWGICAAVSRLLAASSSVTAATVIFAMLWLPVAAANMWLGVTRAGYSVREELPIFLLIFTVPLLLAIFVKWKWLDVPGAS